MLVLLWKERTNTVEGLRVGHMALTASRFHWENAGTRTKGPRGFVFKENYHRKELSPHWAPS